MTPGYCAACGAEIPKGKLPPSHWRKKKYCDRTCSSSMTWSGRRASPQEALAKYSAAEHSGCTLWTGTKDSGGYGRVYWGNAAYSAHRFSYELTNGPIPDGMLVCHKCDTPSCINPDHLFLGSPQDNMNDKIAKGRAPRMAGEGAPNAKLTWAAVRDIRTNKEKPKILAEKYGVRRSTISVIRCGKVWREENNAI